MASEGPLSPDSGTNDAGYGSVAWTDPGNILASDGSKATAILSLGLTPSNYLVATDFDFAIPGGATIDGIVVEIERSCGMLESVADDRVRIVKGGTVGATDRSSADVWPDADAYKTDGSSSDLWGETWADTDINATTFGVALSAGSDGGVASVDHIRITVYYTAAAGTAAKQGQYRRRRAAA